MGNNIWLKSVVLCMHLTRKVNKKQRPEFDKITENIYQSNTLKNIYYNNSVRQIELLPSTFYDEETLKNTLQTLIEKDLVYVRYKDGEKYFEVSNIKQ